MAGPGHDMAGPDHDMAGPGHDMAGPGRDMSGSPGDMSSSGDMGADPLNDPPRCTSMMNWTMGDHGSPNMHPGRACITCHSMGKGPTLRVGGTVYPSGHEPDDCLGVAGLTSVTVEITDATGKVLSLPVNSSGNFLYSAKMGTITLPYHAKVKQSGRERAMSAAQMNGDCNSCHTQTGANGAPGRITLPF
jgi:hypothetical protein